VRSVVEIDFNP